MLKQKEKGSPRGEVKYRTALDEAGQILLIVILVVIVVTTIGLSLVSRSITSLRSSTEEAESQKALAAAEAGIERALQNNISIESTALANNSTYAASVSAVVDQSAFPLVGGGAVPKDEGADIWFVEHNADGTLDYSSSVSPQFFQLYWGSPSETDCGSSAIQAVVITRDSAGVVKSYRYTYDSCPDRRSENNFREANFSSSGYEIAGVTFGNRTPDIGPNPDLVEQADIVFMRVVPLYKDTIMGVSACPFGGGAGACTDLPNQGFTISSTGVSGSANRKITVFKGYPQTYLPYLSYGLFVAN